MCKEHPFLLFSLSSSPCRAHWVLKCMFDKDSKTVVISVIVFEAHGILMTEIVYSRISRPAVKLTMEW